MFEDMIHEKKGTSDINRRCPYCSSASVTLYAMVIDVNRTYKQKAECRTCSKQWHIRYNEFLTNAKVETEPVPRPIPAPYPTYMPMDP